jgi:GxxExxY protein
MWWPHRKVRRSGWSLWCEEGVPRRGAEDAEKKIREDNIFMEINDITGIIIEESIRIHRDIGPGLLESVYEELLFYRLTKRGLKVKRQQPIVLIYEDVKMEVDLRYDLMVEEKVLVELKSQEIVPPVSYKVFKTYLRLTNITIGLLINFNVEVLREGIRRIANGYVEP